MSSIATDAVWSGLGRGDAATTAIQLPVHRDGPTAWGVLDGSIALVVRGIRTDGRLGSPESLALAGPGDLLVVPPDPPGRRLELRRSHDARAVPLVPDAIPVGSRAATLEAARAHFETGAEIEDWYRRLVEGVEGVESASGIGLDWTTVVDGLASVVAARAEAAVDAAADRLRARVARLRTLDDESLDEAVRIMTAPDRVTAAAPDDVLERSADERAILATIAALGGDVIGDAELGRHPGAGTVDHMARRLHLQYREVRLDADWWRESAGPLFARRRDDDTPVALLPHRGGYAALEHRADGVRRVERVDRVTAAEYGDTATMFYRPLPRRAGGLRELLGLVVARNLGDFAVIGLGTLATAALVALVPILTGMIVGTVIPSFERVQLIFLGGLLVSIAIARGLVHVVAGLAFLRIETRSSYQVVAALVDRVLQLPAAFFRGTSAGDLTQRVMAIEQVRASLTQSVVSVTVSLVASVANLGVLLAYDAGMAAVAIGIIAVELVGVAWLSVRMARFDLDLSVAKGDLDGFGIDMLLGIRQIRVQGARDRVLARLLTRLGRVGRDSFRVGVLGVWLNVLVGAASVVALALVFTWFTASVRRDADLAVGSGDFVAFVTALAAFLGAVIGVAPAVRAVANMIPQLHRVRPILEAETEVGATGGDAITLRGGIAARGVEFRYGEDLPKVLDGVDIEAAPGEFIALVGRTGCGKSTLLSVLLGLETPDAGQVLYDGVPLESLDPAVVRSQVGVVMQSNEVLPGTVQSTILGVGSRRTLDDAWAAARLVGIDDEIDRMPMGMLTMVTPSSMSQSQLQRLLVARALVGRPEVLFLDEATSGLDNAAQAAITRSIDELGATRVVIAHRLSTIRNADRIYVLDRGRVVQSGTFEELQAADGVFRDLMAGQAS